MPALTAAPMLLDLATLLFMATANLGVASLALLVIAGSGASAALRCVQIGLAALLLGAVAGLTAGTVWSAVLAPLALLFFGLWATARVRLKTATAPAGASAA
jgi:hypothetical protein